MLDKKGQVEEGNTIPFPSKWCWKWSNAVCTRTISRYFTGKIRPGSAILNKNFQRNVMTAEELNSLWQSMALLLRSHPWHGISIGEDAPQNVYTYIETVPSDTVKYEIDKKSGFLKVDRPQKYSSICPTLYGFIPQTYCAQITADLFRERTGRPTVTGDEDPVDICVLTEKVISHGDIIVRAIPIGGFRMIDQGKADDKIIAVMQGDALYSQWTNIEDCPRAFIDRLKHYF